MPKRSKDNTLEYKKRNLRRRGKALHDYPTESCNTLLMVRLAFAAFLVSTATSSTSEPSFYTIRGVHKWSLSLHLCMQPREFSALLIGCDLVKVANTSAGGVRVTLKTDTWDEFILGYVNKGEAAALGKCEATHHNKICIDALRDGTKDGKTDTSNYRQLSLLRVGAYGIEGERTKSTLQINDCRENPPKFDHRLRSAHRALTNATRPFVSGRISS